jgi:hypothetical protein
MAYTTMPLNVMLGGSKEFFTPATIGGIHAGGSRGIKHSHDRPIHSTLFKQKLAFCEI